MTRETAVLVRPTEYARESKQVVIAGCHRGARAMVPTIEAFARTSHYALDPLYVDPEPGRADTLAKDVSATKIRARAIEARVEDVLTRTGARSPIVFHIDDANSVARALEAIGSERSALIYLLVFLPKGQLLGIRAVIGPYDASLRPALTHFFQLVGDLSARSYGKAILGEGGRPEHRIAEPVVRKWFAEHLTANLTRALSGTKPSHYPIEASYDGQHTLPVAIVASERGWMTPNELSRCVTSSITVPIPPGHDLLVAELGQESIRLHRGRLTTDGDVEIAHGESHRHHPHDEAARGHRDEDREHHDHDLDEQGHRDRERSVLRAVLDRVRPVVITRSSPVETTD